MNTPAISVVIPNFNGRLLLEEIIPPLLDALQCHPLPYEIIIVDDCSADESVSYLRSHFPGIIVLQNEHNSGFGVSMNSGIRIAQYKYLLLLNSDVKLTRNYFTPLFKYFDKADTFGVMGRMVGWDNDVIQDGGKYPYFVGVKIKTSGNYIPVDPSPGAWLYSMYLSGANAFVDREKIVQLKGFDEIFSPFYVEDFELSLRAWRLGWKCYYEHFAICRHQTSSTIKSERKKTAVKVIYNRNKMYLHAIHLDGVNKFLWYVQLISEAFIRIAGFQFSYIRSLRMFLKNNKSIAVSRNNFAALSKKLRKKVSIKDVVRLIASSLDNEKITRF